jgi:hypothetical protein
MYFKDHEEIISALIPFLKMINSELHKHDARLVYCFSYRNTNVPTLRLELWCGESKNYEEAVLYEQEGLSVLSLMQGLGEAATFISKFFPPTS